MDIEEIISKEELSAIKGGDWIYDEETGEWYWVDKNRKMPVIPYSN